MNSKKVILKELLPPLFFNYCPPNQFFTEETLWLIMKQIIPAMATLNQYNITHNDLRPQNIFIAPNGEFKIFPLSLISNNVGINKMLKHVNKCFLAPEELLAIYLREPHNVDHIKADVFSFGMTMLQLASMNNLDDCYCYERLQLYSDQIENHLTAIQGRYSSQLISIIKKMITYDTDQRPAFAMLLHEIQIIPQQVHMTQQPVQIPLVHSQIVQPVQQIQPVYQPQPIQQVYYNPPQPQKQINTEEKVYYLREPSKVIMPPQIITEGRAEEIKRQLEAAPQYDMPPASQQSYQQQIPVFDKLMRTSNINNY